MLKVEPTLKWKFNDSPQQELRPYSKELRGKAPGYMFIISLVCLILLLLGGSYSLFQKLKLNTIITYEQTALQQKNQIERELKNVESELAALETVQRDFLARTTWLNNNYSSYLIYLGIINAVPDKIKLVGLKLEDITTEQSKDDINFKLVLKLRTSGEDLTAPARFVQRLPGTGNANSWALSELASADASNGILTLSGKLSIPRTSLKKVK